MRGRPRWASSSEWIVTWRGCELDVLARPRAVVGAPAVDLERRVGRRDLLDLAGEMLEHRGDRGEGRAAAAGAHDLAFGVERVGLAAELDGERVSLVAVEHPPAQLGRLAERDRQHAFGQRVERAAVADLDLAVAGLAQVALHRGDRLGRAQAARLVEDDPAVHRRGAIATNAGEGRAIAIGGSALASRRGPGHWLVAPAAAAPGGGRRLHARRPWRFRRPTWRRPSFTGLHGSPPSAGYLAGRAAAAKGERETALAALGELAAEGAPVLPGPQDPLAQFAGRARSFRPLFDALRARLAPTADGRVAIEASRPPVAAESIAYDPATRRFYAISNWFDNATYALLPSGRLRRLFALPELTPNGVAVDAARHRLWFVATDAFRDGAAKPRSTLWRVDLATGARRSFEAPDAKGFNDLAIAPDGDVYVTDTPGGALFVLRDGSQQPKRFLPDETFQQPNGIAVGDDGRYLFVAQGLDFYKSTSRSMMSKPCKCRRRSRRSEPTA